MINPAILDHLSNENIHIDFPGANILAALNRKKQAKFNPKQLYSQPPVQMTIVHCLEAFAGKIDFDRVGHHTIGGGMMASPSSTAAYLIFGSIWDDEGEDYLRRAMLYGAGKGHGSFPSAFPSTTFELSWVRYHCSIVRPLFGLTYLQALSTLLETGISLDFLGAGNVTCIANALDQIFSAGNGVVGFGQSILLRSYTFNIY